MERKDKRRRVLVVRHWVRTPDADERLRRAYRRILTARRDREDGPETGLEGIDRHQRAERDSRT